MSVIPSGQSTSVAGKVTAPAGAGVITNTVGFVAGLYQVTVTVYLDGTVVAGDDDNMRVTISGTPSFSLPLLCADNGSLFTCTFWLFQTAPSVISVQAIAAGSAAAVYHAQITYTPYGIG